MRKAYALGQSRGALLLLLVALAAACSETPTGPAPPGTPPAPPPIQPSLEIRPDADAITLRATDPFEAWLTEAGGVRPVTAAWSSDRPEVVRISQDGQAFGVSLGEATIAAEHEPHRVTRNVRVVRDHSGIWDGRFKIVECLRVSGAGSSSCRFVLGSTHPLHLTLTQSRGRPSGTLRLLEGRDALRGNVAGTVDASGVLHLEGTTRTSVDAEHAMLIAIQSWETTMNAAGSAISGRFAVRREFTNAFGPQVQNETYEIVTLQRGE